MTLIATRRYVQRNAQSCLERARVVRTVRRPTLKPGRRSRRPRAFLIAFAADQGSKPTTPTPDPSAEVVVTEASTTAAPVVFQISRRETTVDVPAVPPPLTEAQAVAYSRPFRFCRACGRVAPRAVLVGADGPRPHHAACLPAAPAAGTGNVDA